MDPFLRRMSFLLALLLLVGCGRERTAMPPGRPYPVILEQGVIVAPTGSRPIESKRSGSVSVGGSGSCNLGGMNCGSGKDALFGLVVVLAVVVVVAVVVLAVEGATSSVPDPVVERYYMTLSGEGMPLEVVTIIDTNQLYLTDQQYSALAHGAYSRAVLRPAVWDGVRTPPTQLVQVSVAMGCVTIAPRVEPPQQVEPAAMQ